MRPTILFRKSRDQEEEFSIAQEFFPCVEYRSEIPKDSLVICRYSALPFHNELEKDVNNLGSKLLNSYAEHRWVASFDYYADLAEYTFQTWTENEYPYCGYDGPVVLKGKTNSRKHQWKTHMFAENRKQAIEIMRELSTDPFIGPQGILFRQYIPLKTFEIGIGGLPFTNEFRFFMYKERILSYGYYWSVSENAKPEINEDAFALIRTVAKVCAENINFYVIDIAEKADGGWIVVELNDGSMSGLSENEPRQLYSALRDAILDV